MPLDDEPMTYEQRVDAGRDLVKHLIHMIEGMDRKHPFTALAMKLAQNIQTILDEGYMP